MAPSAQFGHGRHAVCPHEPVIESPSTPDDASAATVSTLQRIGLAVWGIALTTGVVLAIGWPHLLEPASLHAWFASARAWMLPVFLLACVVRVAFFVPASTLLVTGLLFMPPGEALVVTSIGFVAAATLVYLGGRHLGLEAFFARRYPSAVERVRVALQKHGSGIVLGWAFFPAVPTDAISAVAGAVRMPWPKFIAAVTAGQTILAIPMAFGGGALLKGWFGAG